MSGIPGGRWGRPLRRLRPRYAALLIAAGILLAVGVPVGWSLADHPTGVAAIRPGTISRLAVTGTGSRGGPGSAAPTSSWASAASTSSAASASPPPVTSTIPVSGPGGDLITADTLAAPDEITIPSLSVSAPVIPEGVTANGELAIPDNIRTVGWYKFGSAPGSDAGSIVVVGHVDSAVQGIGAFFYIKELAAGAVITLHTSDGKVWTYKVISRQEFPKTSVPLAAIFAATGPNRLVLATCGGTFERQIRSYDDNIVITALPV